MSPAQGPAVLLLIDVQQGLDDARYGKRNNPRAEQRIAALLSAWRDAQAPVVHVQHMSDDPDSPLQAEQPGNRFKPEALPRDGEPVFRKSVNSAFIGTTLAAYLEQLDVGTLIVAGLTTDHCVSTTVRMAANLGFDVLVVEDATATFERVGPDGQRYTATQMHGAALASLEGEFARVRSSEAALQLLAAAGRG